MTESPEPQEQAGAASWAVGYVKGAVIAIVIVVGTVWLPSRLLEEVAGESRMIQDLLGGGLWFVALGLVLWALRWAQRTDRI